MQRISNLALKQHANKPDALDELLQLFGSKVNSIQGITRRLNTGLNSLALGKAILQHKQRITTEK